MGATLATGDAAPTTGAGAHGVDCGAAGAGRSESSNVPLVFDQAHGPLRVHLAGRANIRPLDTADQMGWIARNLRGKRLRYRDLIA